jgi:hypothetical protein
MVVGVYGRLFASRWIRSREREEGGLGQDTDAMDVPPVISFLQLGPISYRF